MTGDRTRQVQRVADAALVAAALVVTLEALFAARAHRAPFAVGFLVAAAALVALRLRLSPPRRARVALAVAVVLLGAFALELRLGHGNPRDGAAAARAGRPFDTRSAWEVVHDARAQGKRAVPAIEPSSLRDLPGGGIDVGGVVTLPLGGASGQTTVFCNEGGAYTTYEADEHGFHNPLGIWAGAGGAVEVGIVGEGFVQGACVPSGKNAADVVRRAFPRTLSLGYSGDGPLMELAGVMEYLVEKQPRFVVWSYYDKDLGTLEAEKQSPLLRRYLEAPGYRQGLLARREALDEALAKVAAAREAEARRWPLGAGALGRARAPGWLQDLVMGEDHSAAGAALRLDRLSGFFAARLAPKRAEAAPDLALYEQILARAKATVTGWGGTLVFVYLADLHHLSGPEHPLRRGVLDVVRKVDLPLVDLQPLFAGHPDPMALRYHPASHCNEEGYRLIGETVAGALVTRR